MKKMPKILTVANRKGGVGKTTTVHLLAPYFAKVLKKNTVIFDLDEQGNITRRYWKLNKVGDYWIPKDHPDLDEIHEIDPEYQGHSSSTDLFYGAPIYPYPTKIDNLSILPANTHQIEEINTKGLQNSDAIAELFYDFFRREDVAEMGWDIVLIDTPPATSSPLTKAAIRASTHCLIPSEMEDMAVEGLVGVITAINKENRYKSEPTEVVGILPTCMQMNQVVHLTNYADICEESELSKYLIKYPAWRRSDILKMTRPEHFGKAVTDATPWDGSCFKKANREEVEKWCAYTAKKMGFKPSIKLNKKDEFQVEFSE